MRYIFLLLLLVVTLAHAEDTVSVKVSKMNDLPVENIRLNVSNDFRFDSNTKLNDNSLFKGKYDSDVGAVYKFSEVDSARFSVNEISSSATINFRHKF